MKLTKLQRYSVYCILLEEAESNPVNGFCSIITWRLGIFDAYYDDFKRTLPELYRFKGNKLQGSYWFKNWGERIAARKACIEETHP